ncbi:MAG TPA: HhH-GPD-type base excision DNA repair protein [Gaiella sp.]|nr:HhH-GPD-type base excision DNA repair protein [Gaiella sp.]
MPEVLHFTGDPEADALIARDPLALLIGFALDQQVTVPTAFAGPLKLRQRLGTLDAAEIAATDPARLEAVFRERPAIHRFPGSMAKRVQELCALVASEYDGDASRLWTEAGDAKELERRIRALPGFGDMKVMALGAVLAKRFGVAAAGPLAPDFPTLGDVDSIEALEDYQAAKRARKAELRARTAAG